MITETITPRAWPQLYKILFRFCSIYFSLYFILFPIFEFIPFMGFVGQYHEAFTGWLLNLFNSGILHFRETLVAHNGSGDTSAEWVKVILILILAVTGCTIWSIADRRKHSYRRLNYYLRTTLRYFLALSALVYGMIKLFPMQMNFPTLSQLATPLGDFLPMRLSWMFIGYSAPYQIFSGVMELVVCGLLLYRRTVTLGLFIGLGVFANVMMINLCYDVPVKLFSIHLVLICVFLLMADIRRILNFFVFNKPATASNLDDFTATRKSHRIFRIVLKSLFALAAVLVIYDTYGYYQISKEEVADSPIESGIYEVQAFVRNGDTLPVLANDSLVWKDVIFEKHRYTSVNTTDTLLSQRYRRGSFYYEPNTATQELVCYKFRENDSIYLFTMKYRFNNDKTIDLWGPVKNDTLKLKLKKSSRKFQLAEKQFHWVSEKNR